MEATTEDLHDKGIWRGWIYHSNVAAEPYLPSIGNMYLNIDGPLE